MRAKEITKPSAKQWVAKIRVNNPRYAGWIETTVWAPNAHQARQMFKQQYNLEDWHITAIKEFYS